MHAIIPIFVFLSGAILTSAYCPTSMPMSVGFDDLPFNEGSDNPIPRPYNALTYYLFQVDQYDGFIPPTSGNQWAIAYGDSGRIRITEALELKQSFDLQSFSYACVAGVPQPECSILVIGWTTNGTILTKTITYPQLDPGHYGREVLMSSTSFNDEWLGLDGIAFSAGWNVDGVDFYGGLAIDDLNYTMQYGC